MLSDSLPENPISIPLKISKALPLMHSQGEARNTQPVGGTPKLKEAICANIKKDYSLSVAPENVIVSCGAKHSLYNLFLTLFEEGDEVILPGPYWVSYLPMVEMTGAKTVTIDTRPTGMKLHADMVAEAITKRTKGIIINSPSNPTGVVIDKLELEKIAELCVKHDIIIISDDIYRKIIFDGLEFLQCCHDLARGRPKNLHRGWVFKNLFHDRLAYRVLHR